MKYILFIVLFGGLCTPPAMPETYTGGVTEEQREPVAIRVKLHKNQLSACGFHWEGPRHIITYVDPNSSLYGVIFPGDREISLNDLDPRQAEFQRKNYGNIETTAQIVFQKPDGRLIELSVVRKPVTDFSPAFQRTMLPY